MGNNQKLTDDDAVRQFAITRSHQDIQAAQNAMLLSYNSLILLSGGAGVAFLALYGNMFRSIGAQFKPFFAAGELFYFAGSVLALQAILAFRKGVNNWSLRWEETALRGVAPGEWSEGPKAQENLEEARSKTEHSLGAFVGGTLTMAAGLLLSVPIG